MEIAFVFPAMSSSEYVGSLELVNVNIDKDNSRLILPNTITYIFEAFFVVIWMLIYKALFFKVTEYVTAKGAGTVVTWFLLYAITAIVLLELIFVGFKKFRPALIKLIHIRESEESFSLSEYVERQDGNKKARSEVGFYKMCDLLKKSKITDATAICDGSRCKVEVAYEADDDSGFFLFTCHIMRKRVLARYL